MGITVQEARNLFSTFALRGGRLRKRGRGVVSYAPFLTGVASVATLGAMFALSTPSLAHTAGAASATTTAEPVTTTTNVEFARGLTVDSVDTFHGTDIVVAAIPVNSNGDRVNEANLDTTITVRGTASGGEFGVSTSRSGRGNLTFKNYANIDGAYHGIAFSRGGENALHIFNHGRITNVEFYGIDAIRAGNGILQIHSTGEISAEKRGIQALHNGSAGIGELAIDVLNGAAITADNAGIRARSLGTGNINIRNTSRIEAGRVGVSTKHDSDGALDINISGSGKIVSSGWGVFAHHGGDGDIKVTVASGGGILSTGKKDGILAKHTGVGQTTIDISGEVTSASGDAINITSAGEKTLILRPGFSLGESGNVELGGTGTGTLKLDSPQDASSASDGHLNLSTLNLLGFDDFVKTGGNRWVVSGVADANNERFKNASVNEGTLRLSGATFSMLGNRPLVVGGEDPHIITEAFLEIAGHNRLVGNLRNAESGRIIFDTEGGNDSLTVTGDYQAGLGKLIFEVYSTGWKDNGKLTIEGDASGSGVSTNVSIRVLDPKDGSASNTDATGHSPILIKVKGKAHVDDFAGEIDNFRGYKYELNGKRNSDDNVYEWRFDNKGVAVEAVVYKNGSHGTRDPDPVGSSGEGSPPDSSGEGSGNFRDDGSRHAGGAWAWRQSSRASLGLGGTADSRLRTQDDHFHFGFDIPAVSFMGGDLVMGSGMSQGVAKSDVSSPNGKGSIDVESHAAVLRASWSSADGFYADGWTRYVRFSRDMSAEGLLLVRDNEGMGMSVSAEAGYRLAVPLGGMDFHVVPQMQMVWSRVGFDDFVDSHGGLVSSEDGDLARGRLGLSWDGEWRDAGGLGRVYGGASLRAALDGRTSVNISGVSFVAEEEGLSVDSRLGVSYEWDAGYAVHGEAVALNRGGAEELRANLGMHLYF